MLAYLKELASLSCLAQVGRCRLNRWHCSSTAPVQASHSFYLLSSIIISDMMVGFIVNFDTMGSSDMHRVDLGA